MLLRYLLYDFPIQVLGTGHCNIGSTNECLLAPGSTLLEVV